MVDCSLDIHNPLVSVILPTYNREQTLERSVASVLSQTISDVELIIVDDGSTDSTQQVVETLCDPRIRYIRCDENGGASKARNIGIDQANGRYIAFQDSDDEWLPEKLAVQTAVLESTASVDFVFCNIKRLKADGSYNVIGSNAPDCGTSAFMERLLSRNFIWTQSWVARRDVFMSLRFDERIVRVQDWDLVIQIAMSKTLHHIDRALVVAHETEGSLLSLHDMRGGDLKVMLEKHGDLFKSYPEILATYYRAIAVANRSRENPDYFEGVYWASKALLLKPLKGRFWLTLGLALLGRVGSVAESLVRK